MITTLLLDRDGVLIRRLGYSYTEDDMVLLPGVVEGLSRLPSLRLFVVSNQSGIGRGLTTEAEVRACNKRLRQTLAEHGVIITDVVFCPHRLEDECACRKPKRGMWKWLCEHHHLRAEECVMVGDRGSDIAFGRAIGCATILVGENTEGTEPTWRIRDLRELPALLAADAGASSPV